eukprot:355126-Chlamydomonas_euryale.AAC.7
MPVKVDGEKSWEVGRLGGWEKFWEVGRDQPAFRATTRCSHNFNGGWNGSVGFQGYRALQP